MTRLPPLRRGDDPRRSPSSRLRGIGRAGLLATLGIAAAACRSTAPPPSGDATVPPAAPLHLEAAVVRYDGVALRWEESPGAIAYRVHRNGTPLGRTVEARYLDIGGPLLVEAVRVYTVTAFDANDAESARSEPVTTGAEFPRGAVPEPVFDERPELVDLYYAAWSASWASVRSSDAAKGFSFPHVACDGDVRATDAFLAVELARHAYPLLPVTGTLDAFHAAQEGAASLVETLTLGGAPSEPEAPGALAAAEWALFTTTGDIDRLRRVRAPLERRFALARDVENGRVALAAEQAIAADALSKIALALEDEAGHAAWSAERRSIRDRVNERHWDAVDQIYRDIAADGTLSKETALDSFRPLAAGIPDRTRAAALVYHLEDPATFNRPNRFPGLPANDPRYRSSGAVEAYENALLARGLAAYDFHGLARRATAAHLGLVVRVFEGTGRLFDAYAPESNAPASGARAGGAAAGSAAVSHLLRHQIGLDADPATGTIFFRVGGGEGSLARHGVRRFRFGPRVVSLVCHERRSESDPCDVEIETDGPVAVLISTPWADFPIPRVDEGTHRYRLMRPPGSMP